MFSSLNTLEFHSQFNCQRQPACLSYLASMKWEDGYTCRYDESATAHTIFHNLKFSLVKAFYGVFRYD